MEVPLAGSDPGNATLLNGVSENAPRGGEIGVPGMRNRNSLLPVAGARRTA
jgi:hypothetical protein